MNIKVGDKVRIKTEEELLADGWKVAKEQNIVGYEKDGCVYIADYEVGRITTVEEVDDSDKTFFNGFDWNSLCAISEILNNRKPQTLDEYICSLPLEERAKWFICLIKVKNRAEVYWYKSSIVEKEYSSYDEAMKATIEALKYRRSKNDNRFI